MLRTLSLAAALLVVSSPAVAHEVRPGYLEMKEVSAGRYEVLFKTPMLNGARLRMGAVLPTSCEAVTPISAYVTPAAFLERWTVRCQGSLVGETISIAGLEALVTEVLVRIQPMEAGSYTVRLQPDGPSFVVPETPSVWAVARTYLVLGIEHILGGIDHLLFVLALLIIVSGRWLLLKTITAFTVAHSITLAASTLGFVQIPGAPVEAVIALSIVFLASELVHAQRDRPSMTRRYPWVVAFTFGLLHGLGFAGALAEVGLPPDRTPLALLQFNVGVELGQLMFVGVAFAAFRAVRELRIPRPAWAWRVPTYAIGSFAAFWAVERVAGFW